MPGSQSRVRVEPRLEVSLLTAFGKPLRKRIRESQVRVRNFAMLAGGTSLGNLAL